MEFHVHTYASLLATRAILSQNVIGKSDQPIVYASRLLNKVEQNCSKTEKKNLTMVFACTSSNIMCWAIIFSFMWIIWHWSIWSINHRF